MARRQTIDPSIRHAVIARYGNTCWLGLPGCTQTGTEDDHIVPYSHGGKDTVSNIRRACKHCNASRQDRILNGYGVNMHIVLCPPLADRDAVEYVLEHGCVGDMLIAFSEIAQAMRVNIDDVAQRRIVAMATDSAYRQAAKTSSPVDVWHIRTMPSSKQHPHMLAEWVALDYDITVLDPGFGVVYALASSDVERNLVRRWYALNLTQSRIDTLKAQRYEQLVRLGLRDSTLTVSQRPSW